MEEKIIEQLNKIDRDDKQYLEDTEITIEIEGKKQTIVVRKISEDTEKNGNYAGDLLVYVPGKEKKYFRSFAIWDDSVYDEAMIMSYSPFKKGNSEDEDFFLKKDKDNNNNKFKGPTK